MFAEYAVPTVPGLTMLAGIYYTGKEYVDSINSRSIPGVFTIDFGVKYNTRIQNTPVTARFYVQNLTGENYWGSLVNTPAVYLGDPRTFRFDLSARF